jgi:hypothetical protein
LFLQRNTIYILPCAFISPTLVLPPLRTERPQRPTFVFVIRPRSGVNFASNAGDRPKSQKGLVRYYKEPLARALKNGSGSDKKVKALELANAHLQNDLAVAHLKLKDVTKESNDNRKQLENQLDAKNQLRLSLAKIDLKKHKVSLFREREKKRKRDGIHQHRLTEIAAREASSKRVKEMAASQKTRIKEKALETSTQRVQTMLETYQGTNSGQFPNGRTNLENVSSCTANCMPAQILSTHLIIVLL